MMRFGSIYFTYRSAIERREKKHCSAVDSPFLSAMYVFVPLYRWSEPRLATVWTRTSFHCWCNRDDDGRRGSIFDASDAATTLLSDDLPLDHCFGEWRYRELGWRRRLIWQTRAMTLGTHVYLVQLYIRWKNRRSSALKNKMRKKADYKVVVL